MDIARFTQRLIEAKRPEIDVAIGILWHADREDQGSSLSTKEIAEIIHAGGGAMPNVSRLRGRLESDKRCIKLRKGEFQISGRSRTDLTNHFREFSGPMRPENSGSVLPKEAFTNARSYVREILLQLNASYDKALFDCSAVMCRRIFETLLIDAFDQQGAISLIKDANGDIVPLSAIISTAKTQNAFTLSRTTKNAALSIKKVGDLSAHNRTFIARQKHIDEIATDLHAACLDLLHLSGQD